MRVAPIALLAAIFVSGCGAWGSFEAESGRIVDHLSASIEALPEDGVRAAKGKLSIAYWHTSHGSQLITGMDGMDAFFGGEGLYTYSAAPTGGELKIVEQSPDVGAFPDFASFEQAVRDYLHANAGTNVVMASWCGQVSGLSESDIDGYLSSIDSLETEFPNVAFVYMTGHSDGTGLNGNLHIRNKQIRDYCEAHGTWLYDFYDIECYDPDGKYYGDKLVNDACGYDSNGDGSIDANWATAWQGSHAAGEEWWSCASAHSEPLNANRKAMAAWRLFALIAREIG